MATAPGTIRSVIDIDADTYKAFRVRCLQHDTTPAKVLGALVLSWTEGRAQAEPIKGQLRIDAPQESPAAASTKPRSTGAKARATRAPRAARTPRKRAS